MRRSFAPLLIAVAILCTAAETRAAAPDEALAAIRYLAAAAWSDAERPAHLLDGRWHGVGLSVREDGRLKFRDRFVGKRLGDQTIELLRRIGPLHDGRTVDIVLLGDPVEVDSVTDRAAATSNRMRGVSALEIRLYGKDLFLGPTEMIAENQSYRYLIDGFLHRQGLTRAELETFGTFTSYPVTWVRLEPSGGGFRVLPIFRGRRESATAPPGRAELRGFLERAAGWIRANMSADGTLPYGYWPSSARYRRDDNAIRQWLATVALADLRGPRIGAPVEAARLLLRNIAGNLGKFYRQRGGPAVIRHDRKVKLGAMALAGLALLRSGPDERDRGALETLRTTVESLRNPDGSFATFLEPAARNDNQNFYPGEALLFLAEYDRRFPDKARARRIDASLDHYWSWHMRPANRNPSFVPWQLMTYALRLPRAGRPDWRGRVFAMADWLLELQETDDAPAPDMRGRFHAPGDAYGPPHASSTAVYLEALCHAARLADADGDQARTTAYAHAAVAGFGQLMRLQFIDADRPPYIARADWPKLRGGIASTVYDNRIRIDNVAHAISAASCWLGLDAPKRG